MITNYQDTKVSIYIPMAKFFENIIILMRTLIGYDKIRS